MTVRSQDPFFSWFMNFNGEGTSYDEHLASYNALSKKYPDSRFLMSNLANSLKPYKSRKDAQTIYDNLSDKHKNTRWAKNIELFLSGKFKNTSLTMVDKNTEEDLVQDTSKINLRIEQKYFVQSIPHNVLIYPNVEMEIIDVRNDEQRAKLYSMVEPVEN